MRKNGLGADATAATTAASPWSGIVSTIIGGAVNVIGGQYQSQIEEDRLEAQRDLELAKAAALNAQANAMSIGAQMTKPRYLIGYALGGLGLLLLGGAWMLSKRKKAGK